MHNINLHVKKALDFSMIEQEHCDDITNRNTSTLLYDFSQLLRLSLKYQTLNQILNQIDNQICCHCNANADIMFSVDMQRYI